MSAVGSMRPSATLTQRWFSHGVTTWAQAPRRASPAMATPARMRPVTGPPGVDATSAPLSPAMKAPEAASWWSDTDPDGVAGRVVTVEAGPEPVPTAFTVVVVDNGDAGAPVVADVE